MTGSYSHGCVAGMITDIKKNIVIIDQYEEYYNTYTNLNIKLNLTKRRIHRINPEGIILAIVPRRSNPAEINNRRVKR